MMMDLWWSLWVTSRSDKHTPQSDNPGYSSLYWDWSLRYNQPSSLVKPCPLLTVSSDYAHYNTATHAAQATRLVQAFLLAK